MISVIVPIYKSEKYLRHCVDSILAQNYTDFELLLIDDGSPDNSGAICDEYAIKDSRVRVFHKGNGGVSSARNLGLDNALGEYVTFCDADDYVSSDWLSAYGDAMEESIDFIAQGFYKMVGSNTKMTILSFFRGDTINDRREMVRYLVTSSCFGYVWVKAFRRELIEKFNIRFDEKSSFTEDAQFIATFLEYASSMQIVDKVNYYYMAPEELKTYSGDNYYSILRVCNSFKKIFGGDIPKEFCERYFSYIKNGAVEYILQHRKLEQFHISLYEDMINKLNYTRGIKNKIRNFLIIKSSSIGVLSRLGLAIMKKISE